MGGRSTARRQSGGRKSWTVVATCTGTSGVREYDLLIAVKPTREVVEWWTLQPTRHLHLHLHHTLSSRPSPLDRGSDLPGRHHCAAPSTITAACTSVSLQVGGQGGERGRAAGGTETAWSSRGCVDLCPSAAQRSSGGEDLGSRRVGTYTT